MSRTSHASSSLHLTAALALALLGGAACSSDPAPQGATDASTHPDATAVPDAGPTQPDAEVTADAGPDVSPDAGTITPDAGATRDPSCPQTASWVTTVEGTLVDQDGAPTEGSMAQLCARTAPNGILTCLRPAASGADGKFTVNVPASARCMDVATMRYLRPLEDRAVGYCALDVSGPAATVHVDMPYKIFATTRAATLPPLGDDTTLRTVTFADGAELDLVPHDYFPGAGEYAELASTRVPAASFDACILAGETAFDGVLAFSPEGDLHGRAALRIPNTIGLAASQRVAVFVLGGLGCTLDDGTTVPEGTWSRLEDGQVSADATTITVTPGVPCLSWVAYRGL